MTFSKQLISQTFFADEYTVVAYVDGVQPYAILGHNSILQLAFDKATKIYFCLNLWYVI